MSKNSNPSRNQLRIIGGTWRGRKLHFPDAIGLRPTGDRIRETLFNWLAPDIRGARCLDLFAGSGALGFEALSRGAALSVMVERDSTVAKALKASAEILQASNAEIVQQSALDFLAQSPKCAPFDLIFIDPPFELNLWQRVFKCLEEQVWLSEDALIYVESSRDSALVAPANWHLHRDKQAGHVSYQLFLRGQSF